LIRYLKNEEIDKIKWDDCISNAYNGIIYAYSWYLDIVCQGWDALIKDDYKQVFPVTAKKKFGINYLFQPFFTQQLGLFSRTVLKQDDIIDFIENIPRKYKFAEINLNTRNKLQTDKFNLIPNQTHELDLGSAYDEIFNHYSENTKRNIKLASKSNICIKEITDPGQIIMIFRNNKGKEIKTLKDQDFLKLKEIVFSCSSRNCGYMKAAYNKEEKIIAGAVFVRSNKKMIFLFSGADQEARSTGAMSFLIDSVIKENSQSDMVLDFEGSNDVNLARFYKSFGAEENIYLQFKKNELPLLLSKIVTFIKWLKKQRG